MHVWRQLESPSAGPDASELRREAERQPGSPDPRRDAVAVSTAVKEVLDRTGADAQSDLMRNGHSSATIATVDGGSVLV